MEGGWGKGEMVQGSRSVIGRNKIDGDVKNSIGKGEAKELICMTHGHELSGVQGRGGQREKNWDNCNSIINKIYFKKNVL